MNHPNAKILIVDDDELSRNMLVRRLLNRGFAVDGASDGEQCLALLDEDPNIDLVLMDIFMPGLNGLEVVRRIRKKWAQNRLPVIMVTARSDSEDVIEGLEAGANDYVVKPIKLPVLIARMSVCLGLKEGVDRLIEAERQRVMFESVGAACHHLGRITPAGFSTPGATHLLKLSG